MLPLLPADFPVPIAIVLHMPVGYTALYAEKLNEVCNLEVKEAEDGDVLLPGRVLLACAGRHLGFRRTAAGTVVAQLPVQPLEKIHRPSADVLFRSAAEVFGGRVLAVVMTGMGDDGKEGAAWVKAQGGTVLTEAEKSCVIYGMPRSIVEAGLSDLRRPVGRDGRGDYFPSMKAKVLIVDDSALARRTLRFLLEEMGHAVDEAADGVHALERFYLAPPDLVILDMVMTGMYGTEVLAKMLEINPSVRVVIVTADIQTSTAEQVQAAGAKGLLNKPVNRGQLSGVLDAVLGGRRHMELSSIRRTP